jgi:hypothetical protein
VFEKKKNVFGESVYSMKTRKRKNVDNIRIAFLLCALTTLTSVYVLWRQNGELQAAGATRTSHLAKQLDAIEATLALAGSEMQASECRLRETVNSGDRLHQMLADEIVLLMNRSRTRIAISANLGHELIDAERQRLADESARCVAELYRNALHVDVGGAHSQFESHKMRVDGADRSWLSKAVATLSRSSVELRQRIDRLQV